MGDDASQLRGSQVSSRHERLAEYAALLRADGTLVAMLPCQSATNLTIGRGADAAIQIPDAYLSRLHARLLWDERARTHVLSDLGSANGTQLNGRRLRVPIRLSDGAGISFGSTTVYYRRWRGPAFEPVEDPSVDKTGATQRIRIG
jgi:adenylate cyclase